MKEFVIQYWWHILSIGISPLAGFALGQYFKINQPIKPSASRIALVAGSATAVLAAILWPGTLIEAIKIGLVVGIMQPFIVWIWFVVAAKVAPAQAESLRGNNGDLTLLPWVKVKKKHEVASAIPEGQPRDYVIGSDPTEPRD